MTTESQTPLKDELARLKRESADAGQVADVALKRQQSPDANQAAEREVLAEFHALRDQVLFNKPGAPPEGPEREAVLASLTAKIVKEVQERGLVFAPHLDPGAQRTRGLMIADLSIDREAREASRAAAAARVALRDFAHANAEGLAAEDRFAQEVESRRAITEADTEALAGIIRLKIGAQERREAAAAAMSSADLPSN